MFCRSAANAAASSSSVASFVPVVARTWNSLTATAGPASAIAATAPGSEVRRVAGARFRVGFLESEACDEHMMMS